MLFLLLKPSYNKDNPIIIKNNPKNIQHIGQKLTCQKNSVIIMIIPPNRLLNPALFRLILFFSIYVIMLFDYSQNYNKNS